MSEKKTHTWVLRYSIPSVHNTPKPISATTRNRSTGEDITLLSTSKTVKRKPLKDEKGNQIDNVMPLFLFEQIFLEEIGSDGKKKQNAYMQRSWEVPRPGLTKADFPEDQWRAMEINSNIVDYIKGHIAVSWKDAAGYQKNKNFSATERYYFNLFNVDELEDESANTDLLVAELVGDIGIVMKSNRPEFENICYGMQINPHNMGDGELFKMLKNIITKKPKEFESFLHGDAESRWYRIVLNKALRFKHDGEDTTIIEADEHKNYSSNGILLAHGFDSLIAYYKSNPDMFVKLETALSMKKKENTNQMTESSEQPEKHKGGRPKKDLSATA